MEIHNIHDAKTHLSRLVERAARGERIVIAKAGTPLAILTPYDEGGPQKPFRKPGGWEGKITMSEAFTDEDAAVNALFSSGAVAPEEP